MMAMFRLYSSSLRFSLFFFHLLQNDMMMNFKLNREFVGWIG